MLNGEKINLIKKDFFVKRVRSNIEHQKNRVNTIPI
jgi:hypothetical protein